MQPISTLGWILEVMVENLLLIRGFLLLICLFLSYIYTVAVDGVSNVVNLRQSDLPPC